MKLHYSPTSPYVRKVMMILHETDQLADVDLADASGTPLAPADGLASANPLTKVPALERPDGCTLFDSRVICQFLDARSGAGLYPDGARRWEVMTLEALADGILDAALLMTYEVRLRPEDRQMPAFVDSQWDKIARACSAINTRWMAHLAGPLDASHIAVGCALGYVDFRHDARGWRNGNDALAAWYSEFSARDSMQATQPPA
ncbi:glutathione S-transferase [Thalassococcus lentus]|uniref:Glutathione S-transferase n=1 Tax=Thalassococcus lentus TaxID=1210524 RepID=A0ABT4XWJ1_9RHOB|nr:glutathione S-transferase [Thalassococcus lentus]MDA7426311.1 glutathione S-transferase [Thalassococcus lentus]